MKIFYFKLQFKIFIFLFRIKYELKIKKGFSVHSIIFMNPWVYSIQRQWLKMVQFLTYFLKKCNHQICGCKTVYDTELSRRKIYCFLCQDAYRAERQGHSRD